MRLNCKGLETRNKKKRVVSGSKSVGRREESSRTRLKSTGIRQKSTGWSGKRSGGKEKPVVFCRKRPGIRLSDKRKGCFRKGFSLFSKFFCCFLKSFSLFCEVSLNSSRSNDGVHRGYAVAKGVEGMSPSSAAFFFLADRLILRITPT